MEQREEKLEASGLSMLVFMDPVVSGEEVEVEEEARHDGEDEEAPSSSDCMLCSSRRPLFAGS